MEITRIASDFPLAAGTPGAQEIVWLCSAYSPRSKELIATASRMTVADLDGTGLEQETADPVTILREQAGLPTLQSLKAFHARAAEALALLRTVDYEVADLFAVEP